MSRTACRVFLRYVRCAWLKSRKAATAAELAFQCTFLLDSRHMEQKAVE